MLVIVLKVHPSNHLKMAFVLLPYVCLNCIYVTSVCSLYVSLLYSSYLTLEYQPDLEHVLVLSVAVTCVTLNVYI